MIMQQLVYKCVLSDFLFFRVGSGRVTGSSLLTHFQLCSGSEYIALKGDRWF